MNFIIITNRADNLRIAVRSDTVLVVGEDGDGTTIFTRENMFKAVESLSAVLSDLSATI